MRISFVVDYRSPIARQWVNWVAQAGHDVYVVSSRPVAREDEVHYPVDFLPLGPLAVAQSWLARRGSEQGAGRSLRTSRAVSPTGPWQRLAFRYLGTVSLCQHVRKLKDMLERSHPDVIHAMRVPHEAIAVATTRTNMPRHVPFVASTWGNDLTLHANSSATLGRATRRTLNRVDALHTDCYRDQRLAAAWGFDSEKPTLVIPGSGGVRMDVFRPDGPSLRSALGIPEDAGVILNARGIREYVDVSAFFKAITRVLAARADAHLICTGMRGNPQAESLVSAIPYRDRVHLLPDMPHDQMPDVYRSADVCVSLTTHDGTPNTLLEAMASGCFPVVGPVESVLEWIEHEVNGLVSSPSDSDAISTTLLRALDDGDLRYHGRLLNRLRVAADADLNSCMDRALAFYELLAASGRSGFAR